MALGEILKNARIQKGFSPSDVAEHTHMMVQVVEDLEREDFRRIAAPIYGRGFVKLYAELLELDPEPLVRDFMSTDVVAVSTDATLIDAIQIFVSSSFSRLPVVEGARPRRAHEARRRAGAPPREASAPRAEGGRGVAAGAAAPARPAQAAGAAFACAAGWAGERGRAVVAGARRCARRGGAPSCPVGRGPCAGARCAGSGGSRERRASGPLGRASRLGG